MLQILVDFGTRHLLGLGIPLRIYGYGLMLVLGFLVAIYVGQWRARRMGENPEHVARIGLLSLLGGILGARAAYIIQHWDTQFATAENPIGQVLNVTSGGLTYYGGVVLGTAMVVAFLLIKRLPARRYLDIVAVPLMIGLAFGRMGCFLNGCCYGSQCNPHWSLAMTFPMFSKPMVKLDGRTNPYSQDTQGPSPVYDHQLSKGQVTPPEPLVNEARSGKVLADGDFKDRKFLHAPRYFHGALSSDQTAMWADDTCEPAAEKAFYALAGQDRLLDAQEWDTGRQAGDGLLRGSEMWDEAIYKFDRDGSGKLSFDELWDYFKWRRARFDSDGDGKLSAFERAAANQVLQADQFALAGASHSLAVKPSQALGIFNALLLGGLISAFFRYRKREGQAFVLLVVLYPITRFVEESIRDDNPHNLMALVFTHNQYTSMVLTTIGIGMWLLLKYLPSSAGPAWADRQAAAAAGHKTRKSGRTI